MSDDANKLKKDIKEVSLGYSQEISQAILNISEMSQMFNYAAGGVVGGGNTLNVTVDKNIPPGNSIIYTSSAGGAGGNVFYGAGGGGGGAIYTNQISGWVEGYYPYPEPVNTEELAEKIATRYVPGEMLVVCVDNELTSAQIDEIEARLSMLKIRGLIIRGATAGTGRPAGQPKSSPGWRIDILARLAETWERHPDLTLAELLRWWSGENMTDDDFAAATDVYAKKVYE